ncbi:uncharacterized protein FFE2_04285 [Fusarium fujikuroi]|nr:uncharacterized protein FFE2_04285 [Fusarium fujikuroi]
MNYEAQALLTTNSAPATQLPASGAHADEPKTSGRRSIDTYLTNTDSAPI